MATILEPNAQNPNKRHIRLCAKALEDGKLIAHPTDTTYALACHLNNSKGIEKLYRIKKKDLKRPLAYICAELKHIADYAAVSQKAFRMMRNVLPGPYTFILPARRSAPRTTQTKRKTIGLRIPEDNVCMDLVNELGVPMLSTSAVMGDEYANTAEDLQRFWGKDLEFILDVGTIFPEVSTIISFEEDFPEVIREGSGSLDKL